ncbi:MAG: OmpA family protein [Deltaproteobacteria bacterium]|nr:OmpA family protein [Deltaproteobacteria bacterium]
MLERLVRPSALTFLLLWAPAVVHAQEAGQTPADAMDVQLFHPAASATAWASLDRPTVPSHLALSLGAFANWASRPLSIEHDGTREPIVARALGIDLAVALGLFQAMELGVVVPLQILQEASLSAAAAEDDFSTRGVIGAADPRLTLKVPLLSGGLRIAGSLGATIPVGKARQFITGPRWVLSPTILAAVDAGPLELAGSVGYWLRQEHHVTRDFEIDDELVVMAGARAPLGRRLGLSVEAEARIPAAASWTAIDTPVDARAVLDAELAHGLRAFLGAGRGLTSGYGTPSIRALVGARYTLEQRECDFGPEDHDGYQDGDFCRDPDNDGDGVDDDDDACPNDPEDADGFEDADGCLDPDNDADSLADAADRCPLEAEDLDGFDDDDGCPDDDNDSDRLADYLDDCPMDPEDADQFEDDDGCPEPGPSAATVTVTDTRLLISERIYFDYDRDTIRAVSLPLLDEVARVLENQQRIRGLRIEGYTDSVGEEEYNRDLSYRRARAVLEYLVSKGVARPRLTYIGYGESNPVSSNDTPEGQALNRRVEFTILSTETRETPPPGGRRRPREH